MLSIEALRALGVRTDEGLARCMGNEEFFLRLVRMATEDKNFLLLQEGISKSDRDVAFEAAHALKGMLGNLALTPLYEPASALTELLRSSRDIPEGAGALLRTLLDNRDRLKALGA